MCVLAGDERNDVNKFLWKGKYTTNWECLCTLCTAVVAYISSILVPNFSLCQNYSNISWLKYLVESLVEVPGWSPLIDLSLSASDIYCKTDIATTWSCWEDVVSMTFNFVVSKKIAHFLKPLSSVPSYTNWTNLNNNFLINLVVWLHGPCSLPSDWTYSIKVVNWLCKPVNPPKRHQLSKSFKPHVMAITWRFI